MARHCGTGRPQGHPHHGAQPPHLPVSAGPIDTLFLVTLPLNWQGVLSRWLFAFIVSLGELNTALFLTGPGLTTLPV